MNRFVWSLELGHWSFGRNLPTMAGHSIYSMNPLFYLLALIIPLAALARWQRAYPTPRLVLVVLLPAAVAFLLLIWSGLWPLVVLVDLFALAAVVADLLTIPGSQSFSVERDVQRVASLQKPHRVVLTLMNRAQREFTAALRDGYPTSFTATPPQFELELKPRHALDHALRTVGQPPRRISLDSAHLRIESRWRLWARYFMYRVESVIHVYPDMKQLAEYAVLARTNRLSLMGVRRRAASARTTSSSGSATTRTTTSTSTSIGAARPAATSSRSRTFRPTRASG